jgi:hypothetical protein
MKVFFTGSPRALKTLRKEHVAIYNALEKSGCTHLSDLVINADPEKFYDASHEKALDHYMETIRNVKKADLIVAEVSLHSMSMGYIVNKALELGKPVIVFYLAGHTPFFFSAIGDDKLQSIEYSIETLDEVVKDAVEYAKDSADIRFNFFLPPRLMNYLDWISQHEKLPRSVYLRDLIEKDKEKNKSYNEE